MKVEVFGHSDDLIELRGDLGDDEFGCYTGPKFLHFGDGTILEVEYNPTSDYCWRIKPVKVGEGTECERVLGTYDGEDGCKCDKILLSGDLKSVECSGSIDGPTLEDIQTFFDAIDLGDLSADQARRIMAIAKE